MTTRRSFFAALVAPLIARWWPKRKPEATDADRLDILNRITLAYIRENEQRLVDAIYGSRLGTGLFDSLYENCSLTFAQRNFDPRRLPE